MGMQSGAATVESNMGIPQKINWSDFWPSDPTSGNISKGTENIKLKEHKHPYVHCSVIYKHQDMEAAQVSISRWVDKTTMGHFHLHDGILLICKKENFTFTTAWMDLENTMLSEISQSEKDKYCMISLIGHIPGSEPAPFQLRGNAPASWATPAGATAIAFQDPCAEDTQGRITFFTTLRFFASESPCGSLVACELD